MHVARVGLETDVMRAVIDPALGGGVAELSLRVKGEWLAVMRQAPLGATWFNDLASYLLVPWSNRVVNGAFEWKGKTHQLKPDWKDGTAIHGQVKDKPWRISQRSPNAVVLKFSSQGAPGWPWGYEAEAAYDVSAGASPTFRTRVTVTCGRGGSCQDPMPVGIGFHPFWNRSLRAGARNDVRVRTPALRHYSCQNMIPIGPAETDHLTARLSSEQTLDALELDDVFAGSVDGAVLEWPGVRARLACSSELGHTVIYTGAPDSTGTMPAFFCLEPVSMVNDGFNLESRGWKGTGVRSLNVGESLSVWWSVTLESGK